MQPPGQLWARFRPPTRSGPRRPLDSGLLTGLPDPAGLYAAAAALQAATVEGRKAVDALKP